MLILGRKIGERVTITVPPSDKEQVILVGVHKLAGERVHLGFQAPDSVKVMRDELIGRRES